MHIDRDRLVRTLADLVRIPSVNPTFSDGSTNEAAIAEHVAELLAAIGMDVERVEPEPGRRSIVATLRGSGGGRSLILYAHLDTVGPGDMAQPFEPRVEDGRMYGRGTLDMKCGLAACVEAVRTLAAGGPLRGDVIVVGVADEEDASIGMEAVRATTRADAAIVTEPTDLQLCLAHKGFCWIEVVVHGRAAHGSSFEEGIDANLRMGRVLARLETLERELRARTPHPLTGPPSLHAGMLHGGSGPSIYAAECRLQIERRLVPGETAAQAVAEVEAVVAALRAEDPTFQATVRQLLTRGPLTVDADADVVRVVSEAAAHVLGAPPPRFGAGGWMDSALLAEAGVDTVIFGPAGAGAHADVEWVDLDSVAAVAQVLVLASRELCA